MRRRGLGPGGERRGSSGSSSLRWRDARVRRGGVRRGRGEEAAPPAEAPAEAPPAEPADTGAAEPADTGAAEPEEPAAGGEGSIWVLLPDSATSPRWETDDRRYFEEAFDGGRASRTTIVNAEGDAATQQTQAEQAIADGRERDPAGQPRHRLRRARSSTPPRRPASRWSSTTASTPGARAATAYVSFDNVAVGATMAEVLEPAIDELGRGPGAGRDAQRRRGGQQRVPVPRRLRRDRRGARRRRRLGARRRPARPRLGQRRGARRSWSRSSRTPATTSTPCSPPTTAWPSTAINALRGRRRRAGPGQRPGRDGGRHPEHPARPADHDGLQADPGRGRGRRRGRARAA